MTPLAPTFRADGFDFEQVEREGDLAIYRKTKGENQEGFELIVIQKRAEHTWPNGNTTPPHEAYPSSESWGTSGFTFNALTDARHRLNALAAVYNAKNGNVGAVS